MFSQLQAGTSSHSRMRLQGKGLKRVNSYGQGDHYIHFKIKIPDKLTEKQKALMLAFAETETANSDSTVEGVVDTNEGEFHGSCCVF